MDPKHITRTSFCNKEIDNVTDNSLKKFILDNLKLKTNISYSQKYAKLYNEKFSRNLNNPHIVCFKSSGTPYLLFCTQINDSNYCFLIDKKIKDGYEYPKIFIVHYRFNPSLFQGTLFETELLRDKNNEWSLLIGDIYSYEGKSLSQIQIMDRMNQCIDIMETMYQKDSFCDICPIKIKKYFDIQNVQTMMDEFVPKLSYRIRGLYFVPLKTSYSKILYLFNDDDYKQTNSKQKQLLTFRIIQTPTPDIYELYLYNEQKTVLTKHSYASIPDIKTSKWVKELSESKETLNIRCKYNPLFKKWVPIEEGNHVDSLIDCPNT